MSDNVKSYTERVHIFKKQWCNENEIIPAILNTECGQFLIEPILDVGAGMGDIANKVFPTKKGICIDLVLPIDEAVTNNVNHRWIKVDFFNFIPTSTIGTLLLSHTQQFLDNDLRLLNKKIKEINSNYIILVSNDNAELFGDIVDFTIKQFPTSNPEVKIKGFPKGYKLIKQCPFEALLKCETFEILAEQIGYLMVNNSRKYETRISRFLQTHLTIPELIIKQTIDIYERK